MPQCTPTQHNNKKKKMWYQYTMEFYSAVKKNEILLFAGKYKELQNIILSEISQVQKVKVCMFSLICGIQPNTDTSNIMKNRSR
jgi:hypothetical protein